MRKGKIKLMRGESDVFEISRGLSRLGWRSADWLYKKGSSNSLVGLIYNITRFRYDYNRDGLMMKIMGRNIKRKYCPSPDPLIVAHPTLVGILKGKEELIYQHGEVVTPPSAVVKGAGTVIVPTERAAEPFREAGYGADSIFVSGLCVEPALVKMAADALDRRLHRFENDPPLTGAFFSSGAEPDAHIKKITAAAVSVVHYGGRAVIFARQGGKLVREAVRTFKRNELMLDVKDTASLFIGSLPPAVLVVFNSRREETVFTSKLFPFFDYFVAPSHERTNWALGTGLPMFVVEPAIGPFAPLNRGVLREHDVAELLTDFDQTYSFGMNINRLRKKGRLEQMARAGWHKFNIDGYNKIADFLIDKYVSPQT